VAARLAAPLALIAILLGNVPGIGIGRVLDTIGLSQIWSVFAPDPISQNVDLSADVEFADGTHARWRPPGRAAPDAALGYHWEMWESRVVRDDRSALWAPAARWIARNAGHDVVNVTLRRRWTDVPPPGARRAPGPGEFDFYTLDLRRRTP
jgi:hypothetical protein